jgi:hypothetical protein
MNFIITSISLISYQAVQHIHSLSNNVDPNFSQVDNIAIGTYSIRNQGPSLASVNESYAAICGCDNSLFYGLFDLSDIYNSFHDQKERDNVGPCAVFDRTNRYLWLKSDSVGSMPIWYAIEKGEFLVTTDLLFAHHSGFSQPTAVGVNQVVVIDTVSKDVISIHSKLPSISKFNVPFANIPEVYAKRLLSFSADAVQQLLSVTGVAHNGSNVSTEIVIEVDPLDTSSQLLSYTMDYLDLKHSKHYSGPRIVEHEQEQEQDNVLDPSLFETLFGTPCFAVIILFVI